MTRLQFGTPLFNKLARGKKATHLQKILIYFRSRELMGKESTTTRDISDDLKIKYNTTNTILHRMKNYGYITGKKETVTKYKFRPLLSQDISEETIIGDDLPEYIYESDILERNRKKLVLWNLTNTGREYAKNIWFNPKKYHLYEEHFLIETNVVIHGKHLFDMDSERDEYFDKEYDDLIKGKVEYQVMTPEEHEEYQLNSIEDPYQRLIFVLEKYFEKCGYIAIHHPDGIKDHDFSVSRPTGITNKMKIKQLQVFGDPIALSLDEQEFLGQDENNQICVVSSIHALKPSIITFLSLEKEKEDIQEKIFQLTVDKKMVEARIRFTRKAQQMMQDKSSE